MMRSTRLKSAGGSAEYYSTEDYYIKGEAPGAQAQWKGRGAQALGIAGRSVAKEDLRSALEGINPNRAGPAMSKREEFLRGQQAKKAQTNAELAEALNGKDSPSSDTPDKSSPFVEIENDDAAKQSIEPAPKPIQLPKEGEPDVDHHPGWDLTFSAPKSVSIAAVLFNDKRLIDHHQAAVDKAMAYIEDNHALTRRRDENGEIQLKPTNSLLYTQYTHKFSREEDVQLHDHVLVLNHTIDADGNHGALETQEIYKYHDVFDYVYMSELRDLIQKDNVYKIVDKPNGSFDLAGVTQKQIDHFSKARKNRIEPNIAKFIEKNGRAPTEVEKNEILNKVGRPSKTRAEHEIDLAEKIMEAEAIGLTPDKLTDPALRHQPLTAAGEISAKQHKVDLRLGHENSILTDIEAAADHALRSVDSKTSVFHKSDILRQVLKTTSLIYRPEDLGETTAFSSNELVAAGKHLPRNVTTYRALAAEGHLLDTLKENYGAASYLEADRVEGFLTKERIERVLGEGNNLNDGQRNAIISSLSSDSGIFLIQGFAGVGKTKGVYAMISDIMKTEDVSAPTVLVKEQSAPKGPENAGVGPTHRSVDELRKAGIEAQTLASFLNTYKGARDDTGKLAALREKWEGKTLFNDEASMMGLEDMNTLHQAKADLGINKMIHTGDSSQIAAMSAGAPFRLMQDAGAPTALMTDIIRQKDYQEREGIKALATGEIKHAFQLLGHSFRQITPETKGDLKPIVEGAIEAWDQMGRDETVMLVTTHKLRYHLNQAAIKEQSESGQIHGPTRKQDVFRDRGVSDKARQSSTSYQVGDWILFHTNVRKWNFKKDESFKVIGIDHETNRLYLEDTDGKRYSSTIDELSYGDRTAFGVFYKDEIEIKPGMKMMWDRSDADKGITNGETFHIKKITKTDMIYTDEKGTERAMPLTSPNMQRMNYGYARTIDSYQGGTSPNAIVVAPVIGTGEHTNLTRLYVGMSRHVQHAVTITDSVSALQRNVSRYSGQNHIALENIENEIQDKSEGMLEAEQRAAQKGKTFGARKVSDQARTHVRTGVVVRMDVQPFRGRKDGEPTFVIHLKNPDGSIDTIWSNKLADLVKEAGIQKDDLVQFESKPMPKPPEDQVKDDAQKPVDHVDSKAPTNALKISPKDNRDWKVTFHQKTLDQDKNKEISEIPFAASKTEIAPGMSPPKTIQPQRPGPSM